MFSDPEILTKVISPAVRMALKLHQDHFAAADDLDEMSALYDRIQQYQTKIFISHEVNLLESNVCRWNKRIPFKCLSKMHFHLINSLCILA